jgi:hypothetical protein
VASAADLNLAGLNLAGLNPAGLNQYASQEQITSNSQFSDSRASDWAYQALSNLIERYGRVAGYANGLSNGSNQLSRFQAAALATAKPGRPAACNWAINNRAGVWPPSGRSGSLSTSQAWLVGLQWSEMVVKRNNLGFAVGQPMFATAGSGGVGPNDGNIIMEL